MVSNTDTKQNFSTTFQDILQVFLHRSDVALLLFPPRICILYHFHSETFTKNLRQVLTLPCNGKIDKKRLDQSKRSFPQLILSLWMLQNHYYHYFSSDKIRPKDNFLACDIFGYFMLLYNKKILWIEKRRKGVNLTFQTMASTTSDLTLLGRKLGALDYNPELYVKEIARRSVGGHELLQQRSNIKVTNINCFW